MVVILNALNALATGWFLLANTPSPSLSVSLPLYHSFSLSCSSALASHSVWPRLRLLRSFCGITKAFSFVFSCQSSLLLSLSLSLLHYSLSPFLFLFVCWAGPLSTLPCTSLFRRSRVLALVVASFIVVAVLVVVAVVVAFVNYKNEIKFTLCHVGTFTVFNCFTRSRPQVHRRKRERGWQGVLREGSVRRD